jgi:hypothetical protein
MADFAHGVYGLVGILEAVAIIYIALRIYKESN